MQNGYVLGNCFNFFTKKISRMVQKTYIKCYLIKILLDKTGEFKGGAWVRYVNIYTHEPSRHVRPCIHVCLVLRKPLIIGRLYLLFLKLLFNSNNSKLSNRLHEFLPPPPPPKKKKKKKKTPPLP